MLSKAYRTTPMSNAIADWAGLVVGLVSLILQLCSISNGRRRQRSIRFRRLKIWGIEWMRFDHDDHIQS